MAIGDKGQDSSGKGGAFGMASKLMSFGKDMPNEIASALATGPIGVALTAVTKIGETVVEIMTKLMQVIIDSSPYLQGVLKLIDKMFKLVLMPVGNMIAKILLPLALKMATKTMAVMQKYANADPSDLMNAASDGFTVITDSIGEMIGAILFKVLVPLFSGLIQGLVQGIGQIFGGSGGNTTFQNPFGSTSDDFSKLMSTGTKGMGDVMSQFGLTLQTGNKLAGSSTTELATVLYGGSSGIADGFQSVNSVLAIGSTGALNSLSNYNIANAGFLKVINTTTSAFGDLIPELQLFKKQLDLNIDTTTGTTSSSGTAGSTKTTGGWDWWQWGLAIAGGLATIPVLAAINEPLGGKRQTTKTSGQTVVVNNNFNGDTYGYDDFVKKTVQAYGSTVSSYRGTLG